MDLQSVTAYQACLVHARADRNFRGLVANALHPFGLTKNEWLLLAVVSEAPDIGYGMKELADMLDVGMPHVTALLTKLDTQKLVIQKSVPEDKRRRFLLVTKKGSKLLHEIDAVIRDDLRNYLGDMSREQVVNYYSVVFLLANKSQ